MIEKLYEEGNWNFDEIGIEKERLVAWNMYEEIRKHGENLVCLDLGCAAGEIVLKNYPNVKELIGTDLIDLMIEHANENKRKRPDLNVTFKVMDNLKMEVPDNYFDVVSARHTPTDAKQVYKALKDGGLFVVRGIDKADCYDLKALFGYGQGYDDTITMAMQDYNQIVDAGFKNIKLVAIPYVEYYKDKETLLKFLLMVPILWNSREDIHKDEKAEEKLDLYVSSHTTEKGVYMLRMSYAITAIK